MNTDPLFILSPFIRERSQVVAHKYWLFLPFANGRKFSLSLSLSCSFLLPPCAHRLSGLGWMLWPSVPIRFIFVLSFLSLFLASLRADPR